MSSGHPRVLMLSQRKLHDVVYRHSGYEFEDVIRAIDDVDLISPTSVDKALPIEGRLFDKLRRLTGLHIERDKAVSRPSFEEREYDLLFVAGTDPYEIARLGLQRWVDEASKYCKQTVCYFEEMWENWLAHDSLREALAQFDNILIGCQNTCAAAERATGVPVTYVTPGIDMVRFCPVPNPPRRSIDVRSMGRRSSATHHALYEWSEGTGATYLYDSNLGAYSGDIATHRTLQAAMIRRARYFMVNPAKINKQQDTHGQEELALRFYEGSGGGAVLLGQSPKCKAYDDNFDWKDSVIEMPFGSKDAPDIIRELDKDPARLAKIRRDNVVNHLRRHDWAHRWVLGLQTVGLEPRPRALERIAHLERLASEIPADGLTENAAEMELYYQGLATKPV